MLLLVSLGASDAHLGTHTPSLNAAGLSSSHSPQPVLLFPRQAVEPGLASGGVVTASSVTYKRPLMLRTKLWEGQTSCLYLP